MRLTLVVHPENPHAAEIAALVHDAAKRRGMDAAMSGADGELAPGSDLVIAVGGDGTVLRAARLAAAIDVPVLGVNAGRVGFLAEVEPGRVGEALDAIAAGDYRESHRMRLVVRVDGVSEAFALNDVVIEKSVSQHVVRISVSVGGERLVTYRTDAVLVATPTGSTAYTFSAGGPLVDPELEAIIVTAVAPHNLFGRPIVFQPHARLLIRVEADRPAGVNVDGVQIAGLEPGDEVIVERAPTPARFVRFSPVNFAAAVREKFHLHDA